MDYAEMTLQELRNAAKELGIKGISAMKKGELVELLTAVKERQMAAKKSSKDNAKAKGVSDTKKKTDSDTGKVKTSKRKSEAMAGSGKKESSVKNRKSESEATGVSKESPVEDRKSEKVVENRKNDPSEEREMRETSEVNSKTESDNNNIPESPLDSGKEANGILEVMADGFGFIRCENYLPGEDDIYVSPAQIKRFNLKTGDIIVGNRKVKTEREKFAALLYIKSINGYSVDEAVKRGNFEDLTPIFPDERIKLENEHSKSVSMRIMDLLAPIGKGQRGMIVAPPKAGKTTLLKQIAVSISRQYRDMHLIVLLIDERPEEVTDIRETIEGPNVEVIYSTFDELPEHHKRVAEMVLERAKRLVEHKEDVVILLDSITRLARAYNLTVPPSGRTLTGGLDPAALHMPKKFFGAARNMREGGSLTVLATALVDTGSKMDDVVFEEFKGTGNMELVLDRKLSERRIFPAIDIAKSGTRRDDLLLTPVEKEVVNAMTREFSSNRGEEKVEEILKLFLRTRDNREFLELIKRSLYRR